MYIRLFGIQSRPPWQLAKGLTIVVGIVGLLALYSLRGCYVGSSSTRAITIMSYKYQAYLGKLVWDEEFSGAVGTPPNENTWTSDVGGNGWGSKQLEYNTDNLNAYQDGKGNLILEARQDTSKKLECWYGPCQYTSARISTRSKFSFTYGLLEARIKIPYGPGLWPAFWLLGSNYATVGWPACGEIDVMENIGAQEPKIIHGSVHGPENFTSSDTVSHGTFADDFHVFAVQWGPDHINFMVDGIVYATLTKSMLTNQQDWVYDHPFNIILDVSVGGSWPGNPDTTTVFPQKMYISYIRLYTNK